MKRISSKKDFDFLIGLTGLAFKPEIKKDRILRIEEDVVILNHSK